MKNIKYRVKINIFIRQFCGFQFILGHPVLPGRQPLTRLMVLSAHAGPAYTLMETRQQFCIVQDISSVKHHLADCASCA